MDRRTSSLLIVAVLLIASAPFTAAPVAADSPECSFPLEVTDATGETISLDEPAETVVTTAPSAAQTLWELDAADRVIGLSMHASFLEGSGDRTNVSADPMNIDIEAVIELEPDLVIAPDVTLEDDVVALREAGVTVYQPAAASDIDDIIAKTETIGALVGACDETDALVGEMEQRLDDIAETVEAADGDRPLVYYTLGEGAFEPGIGTFQHDALERAGVTNILAEADIEGWAVIDEETVIELDPEWILYSDQFPEAPLTPALEQTTAYEQDQVAAIDAQNMSQPAPRILDAIESIHETVYADVDTGDSGDESQPIPGLTIATAVLALLALSVAAYRRR